ncbi:unnamed protein product [Rotaria sp. Silwood1]|nr:unnamed protein product [Rotaria sp. Silwood1]
MILRKIKSEQIVSLAFNTSQLWLDTELTFLSNFNKVTSIILHNSSYANQVSEYIKCFPDLTHLSLYYDDKINYYILNEVLIQVRQQIKRFEIHCPEIVYTDDDGIGQLKKRQMVTTRIKYFLLDVGRYPSTSTNSHLQHYKSWFFMPLADLMKKMPNIQHIHIISNKYNIEYFFDDDQWKLVLNRCSQLKKITLQSCEDELVVNGDILHIKCDNHEGIMFSKVCHNFIKMSPIEFDNPNETNETNFDYWPCHMH